MDHPIQDDPALANGSGCKECAIEDATAMLQNRVLDVLQDEMHITHPSAHDLTCQLADWINDVMHEFTRRGDWGNLCYLHTPDPDEDKD